MAPTATPWLSTRALTEQAGSDAHLVSLWLHGRPAHTQRAYRRDAARFLAIVDRPLRQVAVGDVQAFIDTLQELAPASQARAIAAVKSLLAFGHQLGYLPFDVGRVVKLPHVKDTLAQRILPEPTCTASWRSSPIGGTAPCCDSSTPRAFVVTSW
jgi:integrase/recombinase XerD